MSAKRGRKVKLFLRNLLQKEVVEYKKLDKNQKNFGSQAKHLKHQKKGNNASSSTHTLKMSSSF